MSRQFQTAVWREKGAVLTQGMPQTALAKRRFSLETVVGSPPRNGAAIMRSRDVLIGALVGGILVLLISYHGKGNTSAARPRASASTSARSAHRSASASRRHAHRAPPRGPAGARPRHPRPRAHGLTASPSRPAHVSRPAAASRPAGSGGSGGWPVGVGSIIAIALSAAAVTITLRAGRAGRAGTTMGPTG